MRTVICEGVLGGENYTEIRIFLGIIQHPLQKPPKQNNTHFASPICSQLRTGGLHICLRHCLKVWQQSWRSIPGYGSHLPNPRDPATCFTHQAFRDCWQYNCNTEVHIEPPHKKGKVVIISDTQVPQVLSMCYVENCPTAASKAGQVWKQLKITYLHISCLQRHEGFKGKKMV